MLNNFVNKIFPCEKIINSLRDQHEQALTSAVVSSDRLIAACNDLDGKLCGIAVPYNGQDRRKA